MAPNPTIYVYTASNSGLSASSFVQLVVPVKCNIYLLKNNGPDTLYMRSDPNDASSEDTLASGYYESLTTPSTIPVAFDGGARFNPGDILYWVKCTGPIMVKYWR